MPVPHENFKLSSMTDTAAEPLIPSNAHHDFPPDPRNPYTSDNDDDTETYDDDDDNDDEVDESALVSPGLFIWILTICAGVSGLLFGYEYVFFSSSSHESLSLHL